MIEQQKPEEVPWSLQQTILGLVATLVPWFLLMLAISSLGRTKTVPTTRLSPQADVASAIVTFLFSAIVEAALLIAPLIIATHAFRALASRLHLALQSLGLKASSTGRTPFWIVTFMLAIVLVNILYQYAITALHLNLQTNDQVLLQQSKYAPITTYTILFVAVFIAPFCEEVFFRGFVFMGLLKSIPVVWAIIISSLIFALAHGDPGSFAVLFIIGLLLAFLRWHTRSLWPGIALHCVNNGLGALLIILTMQGAIH